MWESFVIITKNVNECSISQRFWGGFDEKIANVSINFIIKTAGWWFEGQLKDHKGGGRVRGGWQ